MPFDLSNEAFFFVKEKLSESLSEEMGSLFEQEAYSNIASHLLANIKIFVTEAENEVTRAQHEA